TLSEVALLFKDRLIADGLVALNRSLILATAQAEDGSGSCYELSLASGRPLIRCIAADGREQVTSDVNLPFSFTPAWLASDRLGVLSRKRWEHSLRAGDLRASLRATFSGVGTHEEDVDLSTLEAPKSEPNVDVAQWRRAFAELKRFGKKSALERL